MKRIFAWILALLVAVSLFAGCDLSEKDVQFISDVLNAALEQSGNDAGSAPENTLVAAQSTAVPDAGPSAPAGTAIPAATEAPEEEPPSDVKVFCGRKSLSDRSDCINRQDCNMVWHARICSVLQNRR